MLARSLKLTPEQLLQAFGPAAPDDIQQISALRRRVFGQSISEKDQDYLYWRYFSRDPENSSLLCLKLNGAVIAAIGTEPSRVSFDGKTVECVKCADAIVAPEYDGRGIGAWINLVQTHHHKLVIVIGGNDSSLSLLKKLFVSLPIRQFYKCPVRPGSLLRLRYPQSGLLRALASAIDGCWLTFKRWRLRSQFQTADMAFRRFDNIEEMVKLLPVEERRNANKSLLRTHSYLRWRYADGPGRNYRCYGLVANDQLSTFVIAKVGVLDHAHARVGMILDWQFPQDSATGPQELQRVLSGACLDLIEENITLLQAVLNDSQSINVMRKLGFMHRGTDARFFIKASASDLEILYKPDGWFVTHGDSDGV